MTPGADLEPDADSHAVAVAFVHDRLPVARLGRRARRRTPRVARSLRGVVALLLTSACKDEPSPEADQPGLLGVVADQLLGDAVLRGPADALLVDYRHAIEEAALAEGANNDSDVERIVKRMAKDRLVPAIATLHEQSALVAFTEVSMQQLPEARRRGARLLVGWEPLRLAQSLDWIVRVGARGSSDAPLYHALQLHAWPQWVLVGEDLDMPAIAFEGARERLIIRLRRDPQGWYVPVEAVTERRDTL